MTREETILLSAYTGFMLAPDFGELQKFCEEALGRPVWTHDFADKKIFEDLREKLRPKVEELIQNIDKPQMITREQSGSLTCEGCIHEENEHENCNYCVRASYLGDYYYRRPPEGEEET